MKQRTAEHSTTCSVKDSPGENILEVLDETSDWIEKVLKVMIKVMPVQALSLDGDQEDGKVLVNCFVGSSRSATVTVAFLMKYRSVH